MMQSKQTPLKESFQPNCQNLKNRLYPQKLSPALTPAYGGLEDLFVNACLREDALERKREEYIPHGVEYLEDGRLHILSPNDFSQTTSETPEGNDDLEKEVNDTTQDDLVKQLVQEYIAKGNDNREDERLNIASPPGSYPRVVETSEQPNDNSSNRPGEFVWETLDLKMTPAEMKLLICIFYVFFTVLCFGWIPFLISTSVVLLIVLFYIWIMGEQSNWDIFDLKQSGKSAWRGPA